MGVVFHLHGYSWASHAHLRSARSPVPAMHWENGVTSMRQAPWVTSCHYLPCCLCHVLAILVKRFIKLILAEIRTLDGSGSRTSPENPNIFGICIWYFTMSQHWDPESVIEWLKLCIFDQNLGSVRNQTTSRWGALLCWGTLEGWDVQAEGHPKLRRERWTKPMTKWCRTHDFFD